MKSKTMMAGLVLFYFQVSMASEMSPLNLVLANALVTRSTPGSEVSSSKLLEDVRIQLRAGVSPNDCISEPLGQFRVGDCPLHVALMLKEPEIVEALVRAGADIEKPKPFEIKGNPKDAEVGQKIARPLDMILFRKQNLIELRARARADIGANKKEPQFIRGRKMPSREQTTLQMAEDEIQLMERLESALLSGSK